MPVDLPFRDEVRMILQEAEELRDTRHESNVRLDHVGLSLLSHRESIACQILSDLTVNLDSLKRAVERSGDFTPTADAAQLSPEVRDLLHVALDDAVSLRASALGSEHLLTALLDETRVKGHSRLREGLLRQAGIDRAMIMARLSDAAPADDGPRNSDVAPGFAPLTPEISGRTPLLHKVATGRSLLAQYAVDLVATAATLDPIVGRDSEINDVIEVLSRRRKSNPVLVGEAGVGKSAVVEGVAHLLAEGRGPENLRAAHIYSLSLGSLVAGTMYRGQLEDRIQGILKEARSREVILFIDEIHTLIGAGSSTSGFDAAEMFKPALARGEIRVIGATTLEEYRRYIEKDAALERRFLPIFIGEPDREATLAIARSVRDLCAAFYRVTYSEEVLAAAVDLANRYLTEHHQPDKTIDLLEAAGAHARRLHPGVDGEPLAVSMDDLRHVIGRRTGIPLATIGQDEETRLLDIETRLATRVFGQDHVLTAIANAIRRRRLGLTPHQGPIGVFLFVGPTKTGKTELAKALAEHLFDDENALLRFDMNEFSEEHTVSRLIGSPPGYVGHEESGQLTVPLRKRPYQVVLLDEIEKAHPKVRHLLLGLLGEGWISDASGIRVDGRNTIIIMTSNAGFDGQTPGGTLGFGESNSLPERTERRVHKEIKEHFAPEFRSRIDEILVFNALTPATLTAIAARHLDYLTAALASKGFQLVLDERVIAQLVAASLDPARGADPLLAALRRQIEDPLSTYLLRARPPSGSLIAVTLDAAGAITITTGPGDAV